MTKNLSLNRKPSLFRLLGVMLYDTMLLVSVLLVASAVAVAFNGGEAIGANNPFFFSLPGRCGVYFLWLVLDSWRTNTWHARLAGLSYQRRSYRDKLAAGFSPVCRQYIFLVTNGIRILVALVKSR